MKSILIIDDDVTIRSLLRRILERYGYQVFEAPDGAAGLAIYKVHPTDLMIIDIHLPEQNGFTLLNALRRDHPGLKIIAVSGGLSGEAADFIKQASELGAERILPKPFEVDQLLIAIRDIIGE